MQVKSMEFSGKYTGLEIISCNDSGLFAVQYSEQENLQAAAVKRLHQDLYNLQSYIMEVSLTVPAPRKIIRSLIIVRSSANCYRIGYADPLGCVQFVAKTYDEIHRQLGELWRRKVTK